MVFAPFCQGTSFVQVLLLAIIGCFHPIGAEGGNELSLYMYDSTLRLELPSLDSKADEPNYFAGVKKLEDKMEVGLHRAAPYLLLPFTTTSLPS